jgi:glyoxylase-like metal-dependent hydrolase (beta-lactamase superfamily II)
MVLDLTRSTAAEVTRIELPTPFAVGTVNAYLLRAGDVRVLVDCGPKYGPARERLLAALADQGIRPHDLTALVLTHGHVDHVGLAAMFQAWGVPVYAHPGVQTWLEPGGKWDEYRLEFFDALYREMGVPGEWMEKAKKQLLLLNQWTDRSVVDVVLEPGCRLPWFPEYEVLHVPGHAQAAIALWNADTGEFLSGDQLLPTISSNAFIEPEMGHERGRCAQRTRSLIQYRNNLEELQNLPLGTVYPGHGEPFGEAHRLIAARLEAQVERRDQFYQLVRSHPGSTAYDLAIRYFPRHRDQLSLILSETIGYLDWLAEEGWIVPSRRTDGVIAWEASQ